MFQWLTWAARRAVSFVVMIDGLDCSLLGYFLKTIIILHLHWMNIHGKNTIWYHTLNSSYIVEQMADVPKVLKNAVPIVRPRRHFTDGTKRAAKSRWLQMVYNDCFRRPICSSKRVYRLKLWRRCCKAYCRISGVASHLKLVFWKILSKKPILNDSWMFTNSKEFSI